MKLAAQFSAGTYQASMDFHQYWSSLAVHKYVLWMKLKAGSLCFIERIHVINMSLNVSLNDDLQMLKYQL